MITIDAKEVKEEKKTSQIERMLGMLSKALPQVSVYQV
jgi:hypothetical protein